MQSIICQLFMPENAYSTPISHTLDYMQYIYLIVYDQLNNFLLFIRVRKIESEKEEEELFYAKNL